MSADRKIVPLPEIIDGGRWDVRDSESHRLAYVNFATREFVVPMDDSPVAEMIRAHEATHGKITPRNPSKYPTDVENRTFQSAEDARVWAAIKLAGIDKIEKTSVWSDEDIAKIPEQAAAGAPTLEFARQLTASSGTGHYGKVRDAVETVRPGLAAKVEALYADHYGQYLKRGKLPPFTSTVAMARDVETLAREEDREEDPGPGEPGDSPDSSDDSPDSSDGPDDAKTEECPTGTSDGREAPAGDPPDPFAPFTPDGKDGEPLPDVTDAEQAEIKAAGLAEGLDHMDYWKSIRPEDKQRDSAGLVIERPELTERIKFAGCVQKATAAEEGCIPNRMHRYATDGRIFTRKGRRVKGAAVLIDVSGSMHLDPNDVRAILAQTPAAIVACYSTSTPGKGILRIIAEGDRFSPELNKGMGLANACDVEAIEWLAKRKEPVKLWICDGIVTGEDDKPLKWRHIRYIARLVKTNRIQRIGNVKSLIASGKLIDRGEVERP